MVEQPEPLKRSKRPPLAALLMALAVGGAAAFGLYDAGVLDTVVGGGDDLTPAKVAELQTAFAGSRLDLVPLDLSDDADRAKAAGGLDLPPPKVAEVVAAAEAGRVQVAQITLWDHFDEDGDIVRLDVGGMTRTVQIWNEPLTIAIPYAPGSPLTLTGVRDGGGGVTVAIAAQGKEILVPPLAEGQTVALTTW